MDETTNKMFRSASDDGSDIFQAIRDKTTHRLSRLRQPVASENNLIANLGSYLVQTMQIMSEVAGEIANGEHIQNYADAIGEDLARDKNWQKLDDVEDHHLALKQHYFAN
jgi:hypothetical protein